MADSRVSASTQQTQAIDDADESVLIAIRALGDMRNQRIQEISPESPSHTPVPAEISSAGHSYEGDPTSFPGGQFVSRVSTLPIVNTALRAYEHGKNSSRVVKYGAEIMESGIQTLSRPVIDRLPTSVVNLNTLDDFACRQLDRLDRYRHPSSSTGDSSPPGLQAEHRSTSTGQEGPPPLIALAKDDKNGPNHHDEQANHSPRGDMDPGDVQSDQQQAVVQRSRWHAVLSEAGGLGVALSDESMKRLKFCLQWLLYATSHIDAQILVLRDFITQLQPLTSGEPNLPPSARARNLTMVSDTSTPSISHAHMRTLNNVRRDIVHTIRQVVDVVSKYTGGALPEPARASVRGFILKLPQRWASRSGVVGSDSTVASAATVSPNESGAPGALAAENIKGSREGKEREREERQSVAAAAAGGASSRRPSRVSKRLQQRERGATVSDISSGPSTLRSHPASPAHSRPTSPTVANSSATNAGSMTSGAAVMAAQKILMLATESLDMMRGVTGVLKDSLDRADAWVSRLRAVGIQRGAQEADDDRQADSVPLDDISFNRRGSLPSSRPQNSSRSYGRPPSLSQSFTPTSPAYAVVDSNEACIPRHQPFSSFSGEFEQNDYTHRIPTSVSSVNPSSRSSSIAPLTRSSVPSTPGSNIDSAQLISMPPTPTEGDLIRIAALESSLRDVSSIGDRIASRDDGDMEGEASKMSLMSLASRRGSLADLLLAVDATKGISGGVGNVNEAQPTNTELKQAGALGERDDMDVDA